MTLNKKRGVKQNKKEIKITNPNIGSLIFVVLHDLFSVVGTFKRFKFKEAILTKILNKR